MIETDRLRLTPFSRVDFDSFVSDMLTDPGVVEHYHSYKGVISTDIIRAQAEKDFWEHFADSRSNYDLQTWAAYERDDPSILVGWSALLHTELSDQYGGAEIQFMLASGAQGKGCATEFSAAVIQDGLDNHPELDIIATVDIPNTGSIRVLEKLGLKQERQIEAYGSSEMFLYRLPKS
jgi:RimJ/RimL family protein N-acetyltransferase